MSSNKLIIRTASAKDSPALLSIYAPYVEHTAITFEYEVPSLDEFRQRVLHTLQQYPYLIAERAGRIIGYAYASPFHPRAAYQWAAETSIYVDQNEKRSGVGKALYTALEKVLKAQNITNLNACIASPRVDDEYLTRNSIQFHEHLGYSMVGEFHQCGYKFGRWYNRVWMEKMIGDHVEKQPTVIPFSKLRSTEY